MNKQSAPIAATRNGWIFDILNNIFARTVPPFITALFFSKGLVGKHLSDCYPIPVSNVVQLCGEC